MRIVKDNRITHICSYIILVAFGIALGASITSCTMMTDKNTDYIFDEQAVADDSTHADECTDTTEPETEGPRQTFYPNERDIIHLAKALYGECKNLISQEAKESVAWCLLNRYDTCRYTSIRAMVSTPFEVNGYSEDNEVIEEYYNIARDIIIKWHYEKETGADDDTRTLSREYIYYVLSPDDVEFLTSWYDSKGIVMQ